MKLSRSALRLFHGHESMSFQSGILLGFVFGINDDLK